MFEQYRIRIRYKTRQRQVLNALLALGLLFMIFRIPATLSAIPIIAGIIILIFPELIPITFAGFLGLFGFILLIGFQFALIGVLTLVIALLIAFNPDSVAYLAATFLLLYSVSNLIRFYQDWRSRSGSGDGEVYVE